MTAQSKAEFFSKSNVVRELVTLMLTQKVTIEQTNQLDDLVQEMGGIAYPVIEMVLYENNVSPALFTSVVRDMSGLPVGCMQDIDKELTSRAEIRRARRSDKAKFSVRLGDEQAMSTVRNSF